MKTRRTIVALTFVSGIIAAAFYQVNLTLVHAAPISESCFEFSAGVITSYYDYENGNPSQPACPRDVDIPSTINGVTVTTIDVASFAGRQLTSVTLPDSITTISSYAFAGNSNLTTLSIPDSVTTLGDGIISGSQVTSLSIGTLGFTGTPTLVIPYNEFNGVGITNLVLGNNVLSIGENAFRLNNIASVEIPESVSTIGEFAFSSSNIHSLILHEGLTIIGGSAFNNNAIESLTLPASVHTIGYFAFLNNSINALDLGSVQTIEEGAFMNNALTNLFIPNSVTSLGEVSFQDNPLVSITIGTADFSGTPQLAIGNQFNTNGVEEVFFGNNVLTIGANDSNAFAANKLTHVTIPGSVTYVGPNAFPGNQLESITIEEGVGEISGSSFAGNSPLDVITIHGNPIFDNSALAGSGGGNYIQMYADNADFIAAHSPGFFANPGEPYGYVLNPATYTINYQSMEGTPLRAPFISGTGQTLTDYSIAANPAANFSLYYRAGDSIPLAAPDIANYTTPASLNLTLTAGANTHTFSYNNPTSTTDGKLSNTGNNQFLFAIIGIIIVMTGIGIALRLPVSV